MESLNFMQSNYTDNYNAIQLSLPLDLGIKINPDDEVVSFLKALEGVNLKKYLKEMSVVVERDMITYCFLRLFSLQEWSVTVM